MSVALPACVALLACRRAPESGPDSTDVVVPRIEGDGAPMAPSEGEPVANDGEAGARGGWILAEEMAAPTYAERAVVLATMKKTPHHAVLVHEETIEECSSAGGSHAFFTMIPPAKGRMHYGGHGSHLMQAFTKGEVWVASYVPLPQPESVKKDIWCVPDRIIDARAIAMVPVASREEGARLVQSLSR